MKWPLSWHKENRRNQLAHLAQAKAEAKRAADRYLLSLNALEFLDEQIAEAEKRGLDGFDPDRFLRKKVKKDG